MKKKTPFTTEFLEQIRYVLTDMQERLRRELDGITNQNPSNSASFDGAFPSYGDGEDDNAREIAEYTSNKPLELTLEKTLRDVDKALKRLDDGVYGICKYCDKPIDEKRLLARPTSSACVSCKKTLTDEI